MAHLKKLHLWPFKEPDSKNSKISNVSSNTGKAGGRIITQVSHDGGLNRRNRFAEEDSSDSSSDE
jgi:hypothetical protein